VAFTKAIVLSEDEFRGLVIDLFETLEEEKGIEDIKEALKEGRIDIQEVFEFLSESFESLLDEEEVEGAIIFIKGKAHEVYNGEEFANLVTDYYRFEK